MERERILLVSWAERSLGNEDVVVKKMGPMEAVGYKGGLHGYD